MGLNRSFAMKKMYNWKNDDDDDDGDDHRDLVDGVRLRL
jgi:hypothetical protein